MTCINSNSSNDCAWNCESKSLLDGHMERFGLFPIESKGERKSQLWKLGNFVIAQELKIPNGYSIGNMNSWKPWVIMPIDEMYWALCECVKCVPLCLSWSTERRERHNGITVTHSVFVSRVRVGRLAWPVSDQWLRNINTRTSLINTSQPTMVLG